METALFAKMQLKIQDIGTILDHTRGMRMTVSLHQEKPMTIENIEILDGLVKSLPTHFGRYSYTYFGVNLILMLDYGLSFDIDVKNSEEIEVLIISRRDVPSWKKNNNSDIKVYYNNLGVKINDVFRRTLSDAYAFILNNRSSVNYDEVKTVEVTLIHNWQQQVKESQLKDHIGTTSNLTEMSIIS
jgi:hypothetical protein